MTLGELKTACEDCRRCPLAETRTNLVFGVGNDRADIMFIGEGPGRNEDLQGVPFVGRAGQLLDFYLDAVGIARRDVYISNIVKCRPPDNRDPLPEEQDACIGWLREQFKLVSPKLIVCLGRIAAKRLIKSDLRITQEHGRVFKKGGVAMMCTYHPAALLRNPSLKGAALDDFKKITAIMGHDD